MRTTILISIGIVWLRVLRLLGIHRVRLTPMSNLLPISCGIASSFWLIFLIVGVGPIVATVLVVRRREKKRVAGQKE